MSSLKELVDLGRELGVVTDGLDRRGLEAEIAAAVVKESANQTTPLEWLTFNVHLRVPISDWLKQQVALREPSAFTYKTKKAQKSAMKSTDGQELIDGMNAAGRALLDKMANESISLEERLYAHGPLTAADVFVSVDYAKMSPMFVNMCDFDTMPVGMSPILVKTSPHASVVAVRTTGGGVDAGGVAKCVKNQLIERCNDWIAADGFNDDKLFSSWKTNGGGLVDRSFAFKRTGQVFTVTWNNFDETDDVDVGTKRARDE